MKLRILTRYTSRLTSGAGVIRATSPLASRTIDYDHGLGVEANHRQAAIAAATAAAEKVDGQLEHLRNVDLDNGRGMWEVEIR